MSVGTADGVYDMFLILSEHGPVEQSCNYNDKHWAMLGEKDSENRVLYPQSRKWQ